MLHLGEQNLVATFDVFVSPGGRNQIDSFGGAAGEDDFIGGPGVDECGGTGSAGFKGGGGAIAEFVDAAMDVGVVPFVIAHESIDDSTRFLGRRRVVEINQRPAM